MSEYNENREAEEYVSEESVSTEPVEPEASDVQTREDGTYSYSHRKAMENPEEYRIPSYMRDEVGKSPQREQKPFEFKLKAANPSDKEREKAESDSRNYREVDSQESDENSSRNSEERQSYRREDSPENRYSYDNSDNNGRRPYRKGNGNNRKNNTGLIIAILMIVGLIFGVGSYYVATNIYGGSSASQAGGSGKGVFDDLLKKPDNSKTQGPESGLPEVRVEDPQEEANGQSSEESVIPTAPEAVAGGGIVVTDVSDVVDLCMPSVVSITTKATYEYYRNYGFNPFYEYFGFGNGQQSNTPETYEVEGAGSGIIIGDDGKELWIVTNNHVVADSDEVKVSFTDETTVEAYIKGTDPSNDLAVVGIKMADLDEKTKSDIYAIRMGDSDTLRLGESVIAIGNALGIGQSVTTGVVSALNREITTSEKTTLTTIQTDAAINPGNSGGALLNSKGELIGINVAKSSESNSEGMGFAIPISVARDIIENLTTMEPKVAVSEDQFPYLGVQLKDLDSNVAQSYGIPMGILVYSIVDDSPVAKAGMLVQDVITDFNGVAVSTYSELLNELQYYAGGTDVTITVQRLENGAYVEKVLNVKLGLKSEYVTEEPSEPTKEVPSNQGGIEDFIPGFNKQ